MLLTKIDDLNLIFFGFFELQLPQKLPMAGTPDELPQPKILISMDISVD